MCTCYLKFWLCLSLFEVELNWVWLRIEGVCFQVLWLWSYKGLLCFRSLIKPSMSRNTVLCMHSCAKGSQRKLQTLNHQTVLVPSVYCFWTSVVLSLKTVPKHLKHLNIAMAPWRRRRRSDDSSPSAKCLATSRFAHFSVNTLYLSISPNKRRHLVKPLWFGSSFMVWKWIWDFRTIISQ